MKIGITLKEGNGIESEVSSHFGQCPYFLIVDVEDNKIIKTETVKNSVVHGGGGCRAVDELLKYNINVIISGGMGNNAKNRFLTNGIQVFSFNGKAKDAVNLFLQNKLTEIESCKEGHH